MFAQYETNDILMSLHAKTMLLKMYYELDEFNALDSLVDSMRAYIQRKKVMGYHRAVFKNLLTYTRKLLKVRPNDKEQVKKLKEEISTVEPLMERKWLLEQIEKL
jgi:iron-sulfur cluster repair protein YtfE (RIC family)